MYSDYKQQNGTSTAPPATEAGAKACRHFLEALKKKDTAKNAGGHLGKTTKEDVMRWLDDNDLDLMHHAIIINSPEACEWLLKNGFFQMPFEPKTNLYAHLACLLGHRTALNVILQYRKDDNRPTKKITYNTNGTGPVERRREITPLDVAAEAGHLSCVKQVLDQCIIKDYPDFAKYPYVALACIPGSMMGLNLIMKKDKPKPDDIKKAIDISLRRASSQCLDILLEERVKTSDMFEGKNFFHMLYTFTNMSAFGEDGYRRLPEVTKILTKYKYNVNVKSPPNTYPLYSLIKNALCIHDYVNTRYYVTCMRILIDAGADPNFDEVENEKKLNRKGIKTEHGRMAYSSAMHCLLDTVECFSEYLESKALGVRFIVQMAEVLIQNKANINAIGRLGDKTSCRFGSVLHQFAKSSVKLGCDIDIFKYLLRQGADPNSKVDGKYVINTYFDVMFGEIREINMHLKAPDHTEDCKNMLGLSYFMTRDCVKETLKILKKDYEYKPPYHVKKYLQIAVKELEERAQEVWPLKRLCRVLIWDLCNRDASKVPKLPTDIESRSYILPSI